MIEVRLFADLPGHSRSGRRSLDVAWRPGLTVGSILEEEGIEPARVRIILVNGIHADLEAGIQDGDRVGLFPPVGGG
jgi:molybdopterin converting factor small subunit